MFSNEATAKKSCGVKKIFLKNVSLSTYLLHYFFPLLNVCWKNIYNGNVHNAAFYFNDMTRIECKMHKVSCLIHEDFKQFYLDTHLFKMENISTDFTIFFNFTFFPSQSHNILWSNFYKTYLKRICNIV